MKPTLLISVPLLFSIYFCQASDPSPSEPPARPDASRESQEFDSRPLSESCDKDRIADRNRELRSHLVPPLAPFDKGTNEITFTGACFHSLAYGKRPKFDWAEGDVSWGLMLNSPSGAGWLRGNWELLANGFGAGVTHGPGSYLTGGRVLLRYNFVQPAASLVPFCQLGGGALSNDVYHHRSQRMIGGNFEFSLVADIGMRYLINQNWALVAMADFQHISNADTCCRNLGVNGIGFSLGAGYFY